MFLVCVLTQLVTESAILKDGLAHNALTDEALIALIADGDAGAFTALVRRHSERYHALAMRMLRDRHRAEDVLQICFARLWQRPDRFRADAGKFTSWFYRVVSNACLDELRKRPLSPLPEGYDPVDDSPSALDERVAEDKRRMVAAAMAMLNNRQKLAVTLCYFDDLKVGEAAEIMGLKMKAMESLLVRARRQMHKSLIANKENNV